uniref:Doublecortin domain containing 2C n=2 Tax=Ornithorhynchus anatinus TaxID=9258 RepID=A0A6I8P354_ORNAN
MAHVGPPPTPAVGEEGEGAGGRAAQGGRPHPPGVSTSALCSVHTCAHHSCTLSPLPPPPFPSVLLLLPPPSSSSFPHQSPNTPRAFLLLGYHGHPRCLRRQPLVRDHAGPHGAGAPQRGPILPGQEICHQPEGAQLRGLHEPAERGGGGSLRGEAALHPQPRTPGAGAGGVKAGRQIRGGRQREVQETRIKPVVHSELNVPSRWQTFFRKPREINVLTNGNLHIPPTKLLIPKFTLTDWDNVLAMIGEKVFPLGGVRRLYTMDGCLLGNSDELEDHQFYVAAGKENFKYLPYWDSPKVPKDIQDRFAGSDKNPRRKKREVSEIYPQKPEKTSTKKENSVFYAKKGQKQGFSDHLVTEKNPEGGVFKARTPRKEVQGAPYVKDDKHVQVDVPIDQMPAEMIKEEEYTSEAVATPSGDKKEQKRGWKFMDVFDFLYKPKEKGIVRLPQLLLSIFQYVRQKVQPSKQLEITHFDWGTQTASKC